jgi:hypothetical protein
MHQTFVPRLLQCLWDSPHSEPTRPASWAGRCQLVMFVAVVVLAMSSRAQAAGDETALPAAIQFSDLDLELTRQFRDGEAETVDPLKLRRTLGLHPTAAPWGFVAPAAETPVEFGYLLVFKAPLPLGTMDVAVNETQGSSDLKVWALRANVTTDPNPADKGQWTLIERRQVFAPQFRTRALFLSEHRRRSRSSLAHWMLLKPRMHSLTTEAVGIAERAPFGSHPNSIPQGQSWTNTGHDPNPGAPKQYQRGPVSSALPSWYILSWDQPRTLDGLLLNCNADNFSLSVYRGDPRRNPGLATADDWRPIEFTIQQQSGGGRGNESTTRLIAFRSVTTAAIKLEITACQSGPVARIDRFDALMNLQQQPVPSVRTKSLEPYTIKYTQPLNGTLAMVITDLNGRTIRNLVSQVDRAAGPRLEAWDLKDELGRTVPPGEYRWKAISGPPIDLRYQMTPYPNAPMHFPGQTPWLTGESGSNGWMADHATNTSGTTCGDHIYFGAPGVEGGVCFIECDLDGRKQWAKHNFGPFAGLKRLAADAEAIYIHEQDRLTRMDPETHAFKVLGSLSSPTRQGKLTGMAAHAGKVYLSFQVPVPYMDNATRADVVDLEQSLPRYPSRIPDPLGTRRVQPNPRREFLRLLRLADTPPGQREAPANKREPHFPIYLESTGNDPREQFVVVAFREPVPLGSVVFPCPGPEFKIELSVLKPGAKSPNPRTNEDWIPFPTQTRAGWICVPAPLNTQTRALRVRVVKLDVDAPDALDVLLSRGNSKTKEPNLDALTDKSPTRKFDLAGDPRTSAADWFARIEGMKLLRRRFTGLEPDRVRVNSGKINAAGEWDAARSAPLSPEEPAIYAMQWNTRQKIAGLAIKEIDGEQTEVDVWTGPDSGEISLDDPQHWEHVATYQQSRRDSYQPSFARNDCARYLDGYVDFHQQRETRAVRLRVVKQWADLAERGTASHRRDLGGRSLDPRRCRIWGVAALQYLGGEPAVDTQTYQRIETRDGRTGEVLNEVPVAIDSGLVVSPSGQLFGIRERQVVKIDPENGETRPVLPLVDGKEISAHRFTISPAGEFYVYVLPQKVVQVYDAAGRQIRSIGHPGGARPGAWDPQRFLEVNDLFVDQADSLWVVESQYVPRRIVQFKTDGTFVKEMLGNTNYGGGGVLDRHDKSRLYFHHVEFSLDWKTGQSRIKGLMADWLPADCVPIRVQQRTYLATAPLSHQPVQPAAVVYLYDDATGTVRQAAAFGEANAFDALKTGAIQARLEPGKVLADYSFLWSDRNGDGQVEADEVSFEVKPSNQQLRLGRLNSEMRCCAGQFQYQVREYLANGTPVFEKLPLKIPAIYQLHDGKLLSMHAPSDQPVQQGTGRAQQSAVYSAAGDKLWSYSTEHNGVSGLWLPPWSPGYVSNEFGVIGHEVATAGDLGEFFVVHANNGQWKIWTADGLLAGSILQHKFSPKARGISSFPSAEPGTSLAGLTADQEHFHGYFTKTESDGKYYLVQGGNHITLIEVNGLEKFQRLGGDITITPADVRRVRGREAQLARREVKSLAKIVECLPLDRNGPREIGEIDGVRFAMSYDDKRLYLRWSVQGQGPLRNSGVDFHRYFKTGACLDLQLSTNPKADPSRQKPVAGDLRLLLTFVDDKPQAVLYQPIVDATSKLDSSKLDSSKLDSSKLASSKLASSKLASSKLASSKLASSKLASSKLDTSKLDSSKLDTSKLDSWETSTLAGGTTTFDRVVRLTDVKLSLTSNLDASYVLNATVPLNTLGLRIEQGAALQMDWGLLTTEDGFTVKRRRYWSNQLANGTTDEALEARLEPHLWGSLVFVAGSSDERRLTDRLQDIDKKPKTGISAQDLLDDLDARIK